MTKLIACVSAALFLVVAAVAATVAWRIPEEVEPSEAQSHPFVATAQLVERGRYLALAGNCAGCHTLRGAAPYAGGVGMETPYGTIYSNNLTSDKVHGIGQWTAGQFWRAMHNGVSRDGRLLYPAFPYPSFTKMTREDSDAIYGYLQQGPAPSDRPNQSHSLRFPYNTQVALAAWRFFSFTPQAFIPDATRSSEWNRGGYLVEGLGHCIACHGGRNRIGATDDRQGLTGGTLRIDGWYAPSLLTEVVLADWETASIAEIMKTGKTSSHSVKGPMADVVHDSTQYLSDSDAQAMAAYLKHLPAPALSDDVHPKTAPSSPLLRDERVMLRGERIYAQQCSYCHGDKGEGSPGAYPPLAGNRNVLSASTNNLVQTIRLGGFAPATIGNPRPYGMPPFGQVLNDEELVAVLTYIRGAWGNDAPALSPQALRRKP